MINHRPILLVEDAEDDVVFAKAALLTAGARGQLHVARNGQEALDYLNGVREFRDRDRYPIPGVIFLDLSLPSMGGLELLKWIRSRVELKECIVVVLTASRDNTDVAKAYRIGANSFVRKPLTAEAVYEIARAYPWKAPSASQHGSCKCPSL